MCGTDSARHDGGRSAGGVSLRAGSRGAWSVALLGTLALAAAGCREAAGTAPALSVTQFRHDGADGVLLNEEFAVHFSAPIDPRSITSHSVHVLDGDGAAVDTELRVRGRMLTIVPELPTDPGLANGSLRAGEHYTLEVLGYPHLDGVRSRDGAYLARTYLSRFTTVTADARIPFRDDAPERVALVGLESASVAAGEPWVLVIDKAVDPRSPTRESFVLWSRGSSGDAPRPPERIELRSRLVENVAGAARVELAAVDDRGLPRLLEPGDYTLVAGGPDASLRDLVGRPAVLPLPQLELSVTEREPLPAGPRYLETFAARGDASPRVLDGCVGQASWRGDGKVRTRFPAAAGSGADGAVSLVDAAGRRRWDATDLIVPEGADVELPGVGLVTIAAQGTLVVEGHVVRRVQPPGVARAPGRALLEWQQGLRRLDAAAKALRERPAAASAPGSVWARVHEQVRVGIARAVEGVRLEFGRSVTLSEYLASAERAGRPVTCLVAGGDIVVSGSIDCDGPLLLVAGGRVRVLGTVTGSDVCANLDAPLGGWSNGVSGAWMDVLRLEVDEPDANVLRRDQVWSILSGPVQCGGDFHRWRAARVEGHAGAGRVEVTYLGLRPGPDGRLREIGPVADVRLLEDCSVVRYRIDLVAFAARGSAGELGATPSDPWDPPWVDEIELVWE
ncbi:MAG: Ig-like domain-containing protein [Planctomycetota bacterium]